MGVSQYDLKNYAQFQPLSMQEIWAAPQAMRQQHDQLAEEYAQQEQIGGLSLLGLREGVDDEAIGIHKNFMDETKKAADELATKGFIDSGRRKNLYGLKQRYNNEVVPLQNQLKIRQERADELRRMQLQDPTFRSTLNPNEVSLISGIKNPEAYNYSGVSGNQMYKSVAEKASQLSKIISQEHPELISSKIFGNYFTALQSGASLSEIDAAMKSSGKYDPSKVDKMTSMLHGIINDTFNEFGVPQKFFNNPDVQNELWKTASQGLYAAAGTKQFGTMQDEMALYNRKRVIEAQQQYQPESPFSDILQDPEVLNTPEYKKLSKEADIYSKFSSGKFKYTPSKNYKNSKEFKQYEKDRDAANAAVAKSPELQTYATPKAPAGYENYRMSIELENIARRHGITNLKKLGEAINENIESQKGLLATRFFKDESSAISKSVLNNIKTDQTLLKKFKDETGLDVNKVDPKDIRIGASYNGRPVLVYAKDGKDVIRMNLPHEVSGVPGIKQMFRPESFEKLYEGVVRGTVDINSHVQSGDIEKLPYGKYAISGFNHSPELIYTKDHPEGLQTEFTADELKSGTKNKSILYLLDSKAKEISEYESSHWGGTNKFEPVKIGGGRYE